jgi:hypothetical protein
VKKRGFFALETFKGADYRDDVAAFFCLAKPDSLQVLLGEKRPARRNDASSSDCRASGCGHHVERLIY